MKTCYKIVGFAAIVLALVSCQKKELTYEPGDPDLNGCYGVYFPDQEVVSEFDPAEKCIVTLTVARKNSDGAISKVPVEILTNTDDVFVASPISFENGQSETTFDVTFDKAEIGKEYSFSIAVTDSEYALTYGTLPTSLSFTLSRVKWNSLGKAMWRDDFFTTFWSVQNLEWEVDVEENDKVPGLYRFNYPYDGKYAYNDQGDWDDTKDYYFFIHAENPQQVYFDAQEIGVNWSYGMISFDSMAGRNIRNGGDPTDYYGTLSNGVIEFPTRSCLLSMANYNNGGWYYGNTNGLFRIVLPGGVPVDYKFAMSQDGLSANGTVNVTFTLGADITEVRYKVYSGILNNDDTAAAVKEVAFDASADKVTESGTYELSLGNTTGEYTLVAAALDKDGTLQSDASTVIKFVAEGDTVPVNVNCGVFNAKPFASQGVNTENSLAVYVQGEDLTDVKVGLFSFLDWANQDACISKVKSAASLSAENLEKVNTTGYTGIISGLTPGTEFYILVYASNGYEETVIAGDSSFESAMTDGDPLMIYQSFDANSFDEEGYLEQASDWYGTWNYYAVDYYGTLGMREYQGKVKISASETETEGPDDKGLYDEYVLVDGLFPNCGDGANYGYDCGDGILEMDIYDGVMYSCRNTTYDGKGNIHIYAKQTGNWMNYAQSYFSAFIPVADGYYAFVDCSNYAANYNFTGLRIVQQYVWDAFYDLLLVDPSKDENGANPASVNKAVAQAKESLKKCVETAESLGLTGEKAARAAISKYMQEYNKTVRVYDQMLDVSVTHEHRSVSVSTRKISSAPASSREWKASAQIAF